MRLTLTEFDKLCQHAGMEVSIDTAKSGFHTEIASKGDNGEIKRDYKGAHDILLAVVDNIAEAGIRSALAETKAEDDGEDFNGCNA